MRRVSCASTRSVSSGRGLATASAMADGVISWKTMRWAGTLGLSSSIRCQAMASPSRSPSVASKSSSAVLSFCFSSRSVAFLSAATT